MHNSINQALTSLASDLCVLDPENGFEILRSWATCRGATKDNVEYWPVGTGERPERGQLRSVVIR
jgi:hypothetical protein